MSAVDTVVESPDVDLVAVGAGPQLLRALADLEIELRAASPGPAAPVRVVAVDPHDPGAGAVWRTDQPAFLLMNVAASVVDLRSPSVPWDLPEWHVRERGTVCARYPSRAVVGGYLRWAWERLARSPWLRLQHERGRVVDVRAAPGGWTCVVERDLHGQDDEDGRDGEPGEHGEITAARVVLCTGHVAPAPFDPAALTADDGVASPGATVVVAGAALTAFDAVLCLTEGRGGTWDAPASPGEVPRYRASGREPGRIVLVSRSGRLMLPKPVEVAPGTADVVADVRTRWSRVDPLGEDWWQLLVETAGRCAAAQGVVLDGEAAGSALDDPPAAVGPDAVARRWRADLRRARGDVDSDPAWWLGRAWAAAYPDLLASIERLDRSPRTWPTFRRRAAALERWAFGPPAALVARLVALLESGHLQVATAAPGSPDVVAHIPPPGVLGRPRAWGAGTDGVDSAGSGAPAPPWSGLLAAGHVTVRPGESGVLTTPAGDCVRPDGTVSPGLAALGRPTEGPVVDHDSLQRRLHLDAARWAASTAAALVALAPTPAHTTRPRQETFS